MPVLNYKIVATAVFAFLGFAGLSVAAWLMGADTTARVLNFVFLILAVSLGWLIGIIASPYSASEEKQFSVLVKAASAFGSGYLVAKLDPLVTAMLAPGQMRDPLAAFRGASFVAAFVLAWILTFVFRAYAG